MPIQTACEILSISSLNWDTVKLSFTPEVHSKEDPVPGQFVQIKCSDDLTDSTLRCPLSIAYHNMNSDSYHIIFEVKGPSTKWLSARSIGDPIDVILPLGHGFTTESSTAERILIVGGGLGTVPLLYTAAHITEHTHIYTDILFGFRSKSQAFPFTTSYHSDGLPVVDCVNDCYIFPRRTHNPFGLPVIICTNDNSAGYHGTVIDAILSPKTDIHIESYDQILACGPRPMLKALAHLAHQHNVPCEVSLEEYFGCGTGVCLGCAIDTTKGKKRVCHDGPVFNSKEVFFS